MNAPVAVTGFGAICAAGNTAADIWRSAIAPRPCAQWLDPAAHGSERMPVFRVGTLAPPDHPSLRRADRCTLLAAVAASEAAASANLAARPVPPERLGVILGTSRGPLETWDETAARHHAGRRQPPSLLSSGTIASLSGTLSVIHNARGLSITLSATCASAAHAIATAAQQIAAGLLDAAVVGGSDAPLHPALLAQFRAAGLIADHDDPSLACRPFDAARTGTVMGEGAGILILESLASARRREVRPRALLAGWGLSSDAQSRTDISPDGSGLRRAIAAATAGLSAPVRYINTHGTGTRQNDLVESRAIAAQLGRGIPCSSTKPITGHCAGATPALEAILCIQAIASGLIPPTATCTHPDPACPIDPTPITGRSTPGGPPITAALSTSLGIWGHNAALLFTAPDDGP